MGGLQKPGEEPARPGEYEERGQRGGRVPEPRKVTIEPGDDALAEPPRPLQLKARNVAGRCHARTRSIVPRVEGRRPGGRPSPFGRNLP